MKLVEQYRTLNGSSKEKLVYHLGGEAGFFSEFNNMIFAMLYCLKHNIQFVLFSKDANFGYEKGWQDYFLPFCDESNITLHSKLNPRQPEKNLTFKNKLKIFIFKICTQTTYLTSDLWDEFHNNKFEKALFDISSLGIKGNILDASRTLIDIIWHYNNEVGNLINELVSNLKLPTKYIGLHIRRGDKCLEYDEQDLDIYLNKVIAVSNLRDIFVSTDDYQVIIDLRNNFYGWNIYTLCPENRNGYFQNKFNSLDVKYKKKEMVELFASIEILSKSEHFIGTLSSNIGMYLGMRMNENKVHGVDLEHWTIW